MNISIVILILIIVTYLSVKPNQSGKNRLILISCILFIIQSGCRHLSVGTDTYGYYEGFWAVVNSSWADAFSGLHSNSEDLRDPGYPILVKLISVVPSWTFYLFVSATFFYTGLGKLWMRYIDTKKGVLFASMLWLALFNIVALSGIRQMWATAILFYIVPYIEQKKWLIVIPAILCGALIHVSMLFCLVFFFLSFIKKSHYKTLLLLAICLVPVVGVMSQRIMAWMVSQMENDYYRTYAEVSEGAKAYTYVFICTTLSLFILIYNKYLKSGPWFLMAAAVMMTVFVPLILRGGTAIRIGQYFTLFMMFSLPYIIERLQDKKNIIYNIMLGVLIYYVFLSSSNTYYFFWNRLIDYSQGL